MKKIPIKRQVKRKPYTVQGKLYIERQHSLQTRSIAWKNVRYSRTMKIRGK